MQIAIFGKLVIAFAVLASEDAFAQAQGSACGFKKAFIRDNINDGTNVPVPVFEGVPEKAIGNAKPLAFIVPTMNVNTDGTRISYKVDDPLAEHGAINNIQNAYNNHHRPASEFIALVKDGWPAPNKVWSLLNDQVLERDRRPGSPTLGLPCVDKDNYLVSKTSVGAAAEAYKRDGDCDQSKWLDALAVPAIVLPKPPKHGKTEFDLRGATDRSIVVVMSLKGPRHLSYGIVGDKGPVDKIGEASVAMDRQLNGLPESDNPKNAKDANHRFQGPKSLVLIFPLAGNMVDYPVTEQRVHEIVKAKFDAWGGEARLEKCLPELAGGK